VEVVKTAHLGFSQLLVAVVVTFHHVRVQPSVAVIATVLVNTTQQLAGVTAT